MSNPSVVKLMYAESANIARHPTTLDIAAVFCGALKDSGIFSALEAAICRSTTSAEAIERQDGTQLESSR